ncbi:MAG: OmcA/MtrC family decaheme c-type cytochrome [Halioglobus sp.]
MMLNAVRNGFIAGSLALLVACGGGSSGGDRAPGVLPGPTNPGGSVTPPEPIIPAPNPAPYAEAEELIVFVTDAEIPEDGRLVVDFQLTDGNGTAIIDLEGSNVRFTFAKLRGSELGNLTGTWQSYVNTIAEPDYGTGTEDRLQATYERDDPDEVDGELTNHLDGTYTFRFVTDINNQDPDILAQAELEGLDLSFEPKRTHRVALQFDGAKVPANPWYDWQPLTGTTENIFHMDIAATANCDTCHDRLELHGGNRFEVQYCVTCHNPGSTDPDSTNTVDMKVMIHKIHRGASLPSVVAGGEYLIYGFRGGVHDYSNLHYPQDIRRCENCHAGTATGEGREDLTLTDQGDNWSEYASGAVCGSCHDGVSDDGFDAPAHIAGKEDTECASCHSEGGRAGSIEYSHRMLVADAAKDFKAMVESVSNSAPGQVPEITFRVQDAQDNDYDILNDPVWTQANSSLSVKVAWNTADYTNTGNGEDNSSTISVDALENAIDNGDGSYRVSALSPIPADTTGSGAAIIEGHPAVDLEDTGEFTTVPLTNAHGFFSIDEADGEAQDRRVSVELESCLGCHGSLVLHGSNRTDNIDSCVTCHNPRNTDRAVREVAATPPTDGKSEESIDFKTMIHGIHAAAMRENPLQIVGYMGYNTYVYDTETVHYPGRISNCTSCHTDDGFELPLAASVLGTSIDTGADLQSPDDDLVTTPTAAVCSSCHDDSLATSHMTANGANFATSQASIDSGEVVEQCVLCHASGRSSDIAVKHRVE